MARWPDFVLVKAGGWRRSRDPDVRRTRFEDGAARQEKTVSNAMRANAITVIVRTSADLVRWEAWTALNAAAWFEWTEPTDGVTRRVRVRGGEAGISTVSIEGEGVAPPRWESTLTLEGFPDDVVASD